MKTAEKLDKWVEATPPLRRHSTLVGPGSHVCDIKIVSQKNCAAIVRFLALHGIVWVYITGRPGAVRAIGVADMHRLV